MKKVDKKDMLSQEEIDALLKQNDQSSDDTDPSSDTEQATDESVGILTAIDKDALGEIGNISFGSAATALSTLLGQKVDITTPQVTEIKKEKMEQKFPVPHVAVKVDYTDGFKGENVLIIRTEDAAVIADLMLGGDGMQKMEELNEFHLSAVQEAMNQMMGSAATSMSTIFNKKVNITPPDIKIMDFSKGEDIDLGSMEEAFAQISFQLKVGDDGHLIDSQIMQLIPIPFAKDMVNELMGGGGSVQEETAATQAAAAPAQPEQPQQPEPVGETPAQPSGYSAPVPPPPQPQPTVSHQAPPAVAQPYGTGQQSGGMAASGAGMMSPPPSYGQPAMGMSQPQANVQGAQFSPFDPGHQPQMTDQNLGLLMDIPLQVTVELGRTKKQIREILDLGPGAIVELDKLAGEPVDILVNNKLIAKGEVVVIDENFGVRITDIISQLDRVQKLQ